MSTYDNGGTMGLTAFRLRNEQRKLIDDAARSTGVSRSEFLRTHALAAARKTLSKGHTAA